MAPSGDNQPHGKKEADEVGGGAKRLKANPRAGFSDRDQFAAARTSGDRDRDACRNGYARESPRAMASSGSGSVCPSG